MQSGTYAGVQSANRVSVVHIPGDFSIYLSVCKYLVPICSCRVHPGAGELNIVSEKQKNDELEAK